MSTSGGGIGGGLSDVRLRDFTGSPLANWQSYADGQSPNVNHFVAVAHLAVFNGTNVERLRTLSAANLAAESGLGGLITSEPGSWSVVSAPAAGVLASAVRAAGAAGVRHVATGMLISAASIVAPVLTSLQVVLRDGASGAGTILAELELAVTAAAGQNIPPIYAPLANPVGSAATAMTLEFSGGLANLIECVTLFGFDAS